MEVRAYDEIWKTNQFFQGTITWSVLKKQNFQAKDVYCS